MKAGIALEFMFVKLQCSSCIWFVVMKYSLLNINQCQFNAASQHIQINQW